jgi:hypothetical protein
MVWIEVSLALGTWALVGVTTWMVCTQSRIQRTDLKVRLQLTFIDRFDGPVMLEARRRLAKTFLTNSKHEDISETVLELFEDLLVFFYIVSIWMRH